VDLGHRFLCRVYYEDTDAGGIVYHANYLKFTERARTEFLRFHNIHQHVLAKEQGVKFVVAGCSMTYIAPAYLDDCLEVVTTIDSRTLLRMMLIQEILRDSKKIFTSQVTLACVDDSGRACRFPSCVEVLRNSQ
jgi:acyl-CoA thioester hydrolase